MEVIINEFMQIFEVTDIKYLMFIAFIFFGGLILWKMK